MLSSLFINGCSFLTTRPKDNVHTHCGLELAKLMDLEVAVNMAGGGRGSKMAFPSWKIGYRLKTSVDLRQIETVSEYVSHR